MRSLLLILLLAIKWNGYSHDLNTKLEVGQKVWLRITGVPDDDEAKITGVYTIAPLGTISIPSLSRPLYARDLNARELQESIEQTCEGWFRTYEPRVHVDLPPSKSTTSVTISGEIERPGTIPHSQGMGLWQAIYQCGGPTKGSNLTRFRIFRGDTSFAFSISKTKPNRWPRLRAGDQVWVLGTGYSFTGYKQPRLKRGMELPIRFAGIPIADFKELCGTYKVSETGSIHFSKLEQPIPADGLTFRAFEKLVEKAFVEAKIYKQITVLLPQPCLCGGPNVITIGGEVRQPKDLFFRPGLTLRAALAQVGGGTEYTNLNRIVIRRKKEVFTVDLSRGSSENPELQDGDQIIVY